MKEHVERLVIVKGGYRRAREALERYRELLYHYNSLISGTGYYLKPVHYSYYTSVDGERRRYVYYGRYWYRLERRGGKLVWRYVGREKPRELRDYPDPPPNPLDGLRFVRIGEGDDIIMEYDVFERFKWLFGDLEYIIVEVVDGSRRSRRSRSVKALV